MWPRGPKPTCSVPKLKIFRVQAQMFPCPSSNVFCPPAGGAAGVTGRVAFGTAADGHRHTPRAAASAQWSPADTAGAGRGRAAGRAPCLPRTARLPLSAAPITVLPAPGSLHGRALRLDSSGLRQYAGGCAGDEAAGAHQRGVHLRLESHGAAAGLGVRPERPVPAAARCTPLLSTSDPSVTYPGTAGSGSTRSS